MNRKQRRAREKLWDLAERRQRRAQKRFIKPALARIALDGWIPVSRDPKEDQTVEVLHWFQPKPREITLLHSDAIYRDGQYWGAVTGTLQDTPSWWRPASTKDEETQRLEQVALGEDLKTILGGI